MTVRMNGCRGCEALTGGDCGMHGPLITLINNQYPSYTEPAHPCIHGFGWVQCRLNAMPPASECIDGPE